ncbi:MAG TPA: CoA transferase [Chloroflexota bacterium]|nr:CoA transferase [Chloroflexota bacterium]
MTPLQDLLVLDFTTLLPGPLATLWMREAGARVIKIERPPTGDEMREYEPRFGSTSVNFALLNAGKESLALDLKDEVDRARLEPLLREADVLVEQFRPGVMARLGLDYAALKAMNPRLIYCSITGYGQSGEKAHVAAHDLNYIADMGLLSLVEPALPPVLVADIGGGSYPALVNVLLALLQRGRTGEGAWLDISMTDNLFPWTYWAMGNGVHAGEWPRPSGNLVTGGSPRYNVYQAADGRYIAVGALEDRFWIRLCSLLGLDAAELDEAGDPFAVREEVAGRIASQPSDHWRELFEGEDVCCNIVRTVQEALADQHFQKRGLFDRTLTLDGESMPALPSPIVPSLRESAPSVSPPKLER